MNALLAPDKLGGSLSQVSVAQAIKHGLVAQNDLSVTSIPMCDGGEGFLSVVSSSLGANDETYVSVSEEFAIPICTSESGVAVVESSMLLGRHRPGITGMPFEERASSTNLGVVLSQLLDLEFRIIHLGLGGTLCLDGGVGALNILSRYDLSDDRVIVYADLAIPYAETAYMTGIAKGASPAQAEAIARHLETVARDLETTYQTAIRDRPWTGAGGGIAGALGALGARVLPGASAIGTLQGLDSAMAQSDLVVTAEGVVDESTLRGKVVGHVIDLAESYGVAHRLVFARQVEIELSATVITIPSSAWGDPIKETAAITSGIQEVMAAR